MRRSRWLWGGLVIPGFLALDGCGAPPSDGVTGNELGSCLPSTDDFRDFRSWESFPLPDSMAQGMVHIPGPKTDYLNHRPSPGSTEFPLCTIIVKEIEVGPFEERQVFAMAKRGGGYNAAGAVGWEWFELENKPDGTLLGIKWFGLGPPLNEMYGGDPSGCSGCHGAAKPNDYVQSPPLLLSNF